MHGNEERLEQINKIILDIASGNLNSKIELSAAFDEIDAIASGINMLGEELQATTVDRNYFDSVIRSIGDILVIFDHAFKIKQVNKKALDLLQYQENELLGKYINLLFAQDQPAFELKNTLEEKNEVYNREYNLSLSTGEVLPVAISVFKISATSQTDKGYLLLAKDLKQFYIFSDALRQKSKELETFVYKVSHDLKGPVATLQGLLQLVYSSNDTDRHRYLELMTQSLQKLDKSIVSLLNFTLSNQTDLHSQDVELQQQVDDVISTLNDLSGRYDVHIYNEVPEGLILTTIPELLNVILQNFIENAIKYRRSTSEPFVRITAELENKEVIIRICDNGLGMSPHVHQRAFDMYFRGDTASPGSGLGLYIAKNNLEKLGGSVTLSSRNGEGTEALLRIPNLSR